jgi:hypothetical protein
MYLVYDERITKIQNRRRLKPKEDGWEQKDKLQISKLDKAAFLKGNSSCCFLKRRFKML